jgi:GNAT superfamily N-acetyltransferase
VERFVVFDAELDDHHLTGLAHHHLAILAVRPDRQGQGTGTALLDAHHAVLDDEGIVAYLEASDERTRSIYLQHRYADYRTPVEPPPSSFLHGHRSTPGQPADRVHMYPMVRYPQSRAPGELAGKIA